MCVVLMGNACGADEACVVLHRVVLQGVLRLLMWGGRMLLMRHVCTADEGCVL